MSESAVYDFCA